MKRTNGSFGLWLWTYTPLIFLLCALHNAFSWAGKPGTTLFIPNVATCALAVLTSVSPFVRRRLWEIERHSMNSACVRNYQRSLYQVWFAFFVLVLGTLWWGLAFMLF